MTTTDDIAHGPALAWKRIVEAWPMILCLLATLVYLVRFETKVTSQLDNMERRVAKHDAFVPRVAAVEAKLGEYDKNIRLFWEKDWPELKAQIDRLEQRQESDMKEIRGRLDRILRQVRR